MGDGRTCISIILFVIFLMIDAILYAFSSALNNINENDIENEAEEGNKKAEKLKKIMNNPGRFSDTLDIVVFTTNIIAGAYILGVIGNKIINSVEAKSWQVYIPVGIGMLIIFLVFGVLIPKKCAKRATKKTALALIGPARMFMCILLPVNFIVTLLANLILKIFGINPNEKVDNVTEEEIITMVNEGQEQGVLEAGEAEMINNIFELNDKHAGDIMTHRASIVALDANMTLEQVIQAQIDGNYSRFPVYEEDIDHIIGTLHIRDAIILHRNIPNRKKAISKINGLLRPAFFVPETRDIDDLLKEMQQEKIHMGIVVDEYGQTAGIISMEDIIEEIVGNILDEYDEEEEVIEHNDEDNYVVDGLIELEDLSKLLGVKIESDEYETLNGFLISKLGRIPEENEREEIVLFGYRFTILEVSGNVIRKVSITREADKDSEEETNDGTV